MIVMKFGGTSVGDPARIRTVEALVRERLALRPVVVVSALSKVTDALLETARRAVETGRVETGAIEERHAAVLCALELPPDLVRPELDELRSILLGVALVRELTARTQDSIASYGERMSARTVAAHLRARGLEATAVPAWDAGIITDSRFGQARPLAGIEPEVGRRLAAVPGVPVVTGYIAKDAQGHVTTLGRGGSDYTASIVGAAVDAEEIQIWTDVDGILTTDPKVCPKARVLDEVSFDEASELAYFGAKVVHPMTMVPAVLRDIPIRVLNTFNPKAPGTVIVRRSTRSREVVKGIALKKGVRVINLVSARMLGTHGFIHKMGEVFDRHEVVLDMIATSEVSVSVTSEGTEAERLEGCLADLRAIAREVSVESDRTILCVVGDGIRDTPGIAAKAFAALGRAGINVLMISMGATRVNLGIVVDARDAEAGVRALHEEFFERDG